VGRQVPAVVVTEGLGKDYRPPGRWRDLARGRLLGTPSPALRDVSLTIHAGEVVVVMGENGAGKSTLFKLLGGLLLPTYGSARVDGHDVARGGAALRACAVYVGGESRAMQLRLSVRQNLEFFAALFGHDDMAARIDSVLARVGLSDAADKRAGELSTGMHKRLGLARGLLGEPRLWLLDEPTSGLDARAARSVRQLVRELAGQGAAVLVATHLMDDARELARRGLVLAGGRVVYDGAVDGLEAQLA
jgi:ABC-2 type transport system ATP-binding protein